MTRDLELAIEGMMLPDVGADSTLDRDADVFEADVRPRFEAVVRDLDADDGAPLAGAFL